LETSLKENSKFIVPSGSDLVNVLSEMGGIVPLKAKDPTPLTPSPKREGE
jgi:hypothetical protein